MQEIYKDISWYEWLYQVSNLGNVKSCNMICWTKNTNKKRINKWRILKWNIKWNWYLWVTLVNNWKKRYFRINRLVLFTFEWIDLNNIELFSCHINDNPSDNRLENLFIWTHKENMKDKKDKWRAIKWINHKLCKINEEIVREIRSTDCSIRWIKSKLAKKFNVSKSIITRIINHKNWKHVCP